VYTKTVKTAEKKKDEELTPKRLGPDFDNYSTATTVPCAPNVYAVFETEAPAKKVVSEVVDISNEPSPVSSLECSEKRTLCTLDDDMKLSDLRYSQMAKRGASAYADPSTPSGKSPPKKKPDTCPSDEKKAICESKINNKENESFSTVAPYSVCSNSEDTNKQSSKMLPCRKDKQDQVSALADYKNRMEKKISKQEAKPQKQTVVAGDKNNNITFRAVQPPPPPLKQPSYVGKVTKKKNKVESEWALKPSACQSAAAFKWAVHIKRAHVTSKRCAAAIGKVSRAADKEADDVYGELLIDVGCGRFDPVKAKEMIDSFEGPAAN